ncbi:MAG: VCBS repeat-containing protein [Pirellulales bacterium]
MKLNDFCRLLIVFLCGPFLALTLVVRNTSSASEPTWKPQEIETKLTIGYAVSLCDVNDDKKPDIVVVDADRVLWYENPTWKRHEMIVGGTLRDNVCVAPLDIDGDGRLDFALGADWKPFNTNSGGTLQWLRRGATLDEPWTVHPIGTEPTIHRMKVADFDGDGKPELLASPLMGRGTTKPDYAEAGARQLLYKLPADPVKDPWTPRVINDDLHVTHNVWPCDFDGDGKEDELLIVAFEGVFLLEPTADGPWKKTQLGAGNQETSPNRGASEIKLGRFVDKAPYIATIEPWHGFQVVVYTPTTEKTALWTRTVVDDELLWGHAVWCANVDDDADEELIIGVRDQKNAEHRAGIRIYDPVRDPKTGATTWKRKVVDPGGVAVEDAAAADLDGDGRIDIVACGRATKNVKIYWNVLENGK